MFHFEQRFDFLKTFSFCIIFLMKSQEKNFVCGKTGKQRLIDQFRITEMDFQRELLPIFRVYQFCGFAPFPLPLDFSRTIPKRSQYKWYIYNGMIIIFFATLVLYNMISYQMFLDGSETKMLTYLSFIMISSVRWLAVVIAIESVLNGKQQVEFISKLCTIDDIFTKELGMKPNYKRMRCVAIFWLAVWFTKSSILTSIFLVDVIRGNISAWEKCFWFLVTIPLILSAIRYYQVTQYIAALGYRFEMINERLNYIYGSTKRLNTKDKLTKKEKSTMNRTESTTSDNERIYDEIICLRNIYHILWECTGLLNKPFRWSLLTLIATSFFVIVVNYYRTLVWLLIDRHTDETSNIVMYFIWCSGHVFYFIKLSSTCHNVLQQVR